MKAKRPKQQTSMLAYSTYYSKNNNILHQIWHATSKSGKKKRKKTKSGFWESEVVEKTKHEELKIADAKAQKTSAKKVKGIRYIFVGRRLWKFSKIFLYNGFYLINEPPVLNFIFARVLRLAKFWPSLTSLNWVMVIALNQYCYLDLELDLPSTDIDLAFSTGFLLEKLIFDNLVKNLRLCPIFSIFGQFFCNFLKTER